MNKRWTLASIVIFSAIEIGLLISVLVCKGNAVPALQFTSIVLAFSFSLIFLNFKKGQYITQLALLFTVIADVFLVLARPQNQSVAMTSFSITQVLYFTKLLKETESKKVRLSNLITRIVAIVVIEVTTLFVLGEKADFVSLISMFYFINLILNMIFAFVNFKKNPLFAIGLLLFMFCDIFIGLQCAIGVYIDIPSTSIIYKITFSPFNWAWLFYIPSQALLSISAAPLERLKITKRSFN